MKNIFYLLFILAILLVGVLGDDQPAEDDTPTPQTAPLEVASTGPLAEKPPAAPHPIQVNVNDGATDVKINLSNGTDPEGCKAYCSYTNTLSGATDLSGGILGKTMACILAIFLICCFV